MPPAEISVLILYVYLPFLIFKNDFLLSFSVTTTVFLSYARKLTDALLSHTRSRFSSLLFISVAFFTDTRAQDTPETSALLSFLYFISVGCASRSQIFVTVCATEEDGQVEVKFTGVKCGG